MASAEQGLGNANEARQRLVDVLEMSLKARLVIPLMVSLPLAGQLLTDRSETERAVELYALSRQFFMRGRNPLIDALARGIMDAAASTLSPDVTAAAEARGQTLNILDTATALLAEFSEGDGGPLNPPMGPDPTSPSPLTGPSSSPRPRVTHNLPPQLTPFIGRDEELAALADLIADPKVRLITIVGPGGMGKTRLSLAAVERQLEASPSEGGPFPNSIFFIALAPLRSAEHIVPTIAEALDFQMEGGQGGRSPRQQLLDYLRARAECCWCWTTSST